MFLLHGCKAAWAVGIGFLVAASLAGGQSAAQSHLRISGIYPHLATFNQPDDVADRPNHGECGTGAIVPWADRLWYLTYPQHKTTGSNDKLYEVDAYLNRVVRPESVGGTHAARMIHRESNQLILGPYFIDARRNVRAADLTKLRGRMTAVMRHLEDPANKVYFFDMEGAIYEVDVHTLDVNKLFNKPVPGWHGKGGYTAQGRVVIANNGERGGGGGLADVLVGGPPVGEEAGALAEWDGRQWRIVERKQFLDVTGPGGIYGSPDDDAPLWAIGWDKRSVILKLLDGGRWQTFRLPKASHTFDPRHGWFTEWPRIRAIAAGRFMACVHGSFLDFPPTFSAENTAGIRPLATHLRYIPDFSHWAPAEGPYQGKDCLILGADDASMMGNPMCGQGQSNLWFGTADELEHFGPRSGWGGPWRDDLVVAGEPSDPFLIAGYRDRCLHLALGPRAATASLVARCTEKFTINQLPEKLRDAVRVTIARGDYHQPAPGYAFSVDRDVVVHLAVDARGEPELDASWQKTELTLTWDGYTDAVYVRRFARGRVEIPGHTRPHGPGAYALPNMCFVEPASDEPGELEITDLPEGLMAQVSRPDLSQVAQPAGDVTFTLQIDKKGDGRWTAYESLRVSQGGYAFHLLPPELEAEWIRVVADRDCRATAYFHCRSPRPEAPGEAALFDALAEAGTSGGYTAGLIRPAAHNRSLQWLVEPVSAGGELQPAEYREVDLVGTTGLQFTPFQDGDVDSRRLTAAGSSPGDGRRTLSAGYADEVRTIADVKQDFEVDAASVLVTSRDGRRWRLPKGPAALDEPAAFGWPRGVREAVSERYLANLHGTFYEIPRASDNQSPDFQRIKPVAGHAKLIADFCTWRGLLVLSGTRAEAKPDGQFFAAADGRGVWFGAIDDLWKLGKPAGHGGPWLDAPVEAGQPSDPYLMTGYDRKTLALSHDQGAAVKFTVEIDFDHGGFSRYAELTVPPGETLRHQFPPGFQAHWVRLATDKPCRATAVLEYE